MISLRNSPSFPVAVGLALAVGLPLAPTHATTPPPPGCEALGVLSPAVGWLSPVVGALSPVVGVLSPAVGRLSPAVGFLSPALGTLSPAVGTLSPVTECAGLPPLL